MDTASPPILLPVDGFDSSVRAARHCAILAKALGSSVLLLNVQPGIEDWQTHGIAHHAAEVHLRSLAEKAVAEAAKVLSEAGIAFETRIEFGDAPQVIANVAAECGCSGVVMGTRGLGEVKMLLMGSVGARVIHLVHVPVTFVH
jgi:nucleotide-binding universal stress UspA family protein